MNETNLFVTAVQLLVPQPCFDKFFLDFDFFNGNIHILLCSNHDLNRNLLSKLNF